MKEDLAIAKNSLLALYDENRQLRKELGKEERTDALKMRQESLTKMQSEESDGPRTYTGDAIELQQRLDEERRLRQESDKELEIQVIIYT